MKPHFSRTGKVQAIHMTQKYRNISFSKRKRKTSILIQAGRFFRPNLDICLFASLCHRAKEKLRVCLNKGLDMRKLTGSFDFCKLTGNSGMHKLTKRIGMCAYMLTGKGFFLQVKSLTI